MFRLRKRLKNELLNPENQGEHLILLRAGIQWAITALDEELEQVAEAEFQKPIIPNRWVPENVPHG
jgi:hypothetical protein